MHFDGSLRGARWLPAGLAWLLATAAVAAAPEAELPSARSRSGGLAELAETSAQRVPGAAAAARAAGEADPVLAALALVGGAVEARRVRIESERASGEGPAPVTVIVVREGFLDDSVYGDWHRIELSPLQDTHGWKVEALTRAVRCRPGRGAEAWRGQRCR